MSAGLQERLLLERESEAEAVEWALESAVAGRGRLLLVEGRPGEGKTELLVLARRHGLKHGLDVLAARGSELEKDVPFGVVVELFGRPLQRMQPGDRTLFRGAAELAASLFSAAPMPGEDRPEASGHALVHGLYWLLANLSERSPCLVTVDDAHWADVQSLRFLHYLAERLDGLPVALAVALRPQGTYDRGHPMARLRAASGARTLTLQPLSEHATRHLARHLFFPGAGDEFCAAVHAAPPAGTRSSSERFSRHSTARRSPRRPGRPNTFERSFPSRLSGPPGLRWRQWARKRSDWPRPWPSSGRTPTCTTAPGWPASIRRPPSPPPTS